MGDNSIEFVEHLLEIWADKNCAVLIDWRMPVKKIIELLTEAKVKKCYFDSRQIKDLDLHKIREIECIFYSSKSNLVEKFPENSMKRFIPCYSQEEAVILYSSGTTGRSKGAILSYYAINVNADSICSYMELNSSDAIYIAKTLAHSSTLVGELLVALKVKCHLYISSTIVPPRLTLDNIEKYKITTFCTNPTLLSLYSEVALKKTYSFASLKAIYTSGSILTKAQYEVAVQSFPYVSILNVYGLTEAGPRVAAQTIHAKNVSGSVGQAIKGVQIRIEHKEDLNDEKYGIIQVKTPSKYLGYVSSDGQMKNLNDEWVLTGDIGYFDEEHNLFIVGRYDNMILVGSHNVFPEDVERTILQSGIVWDCLISSVQDDLYGEKIVCRYVSNQPKEKELRKFCLAHLATYEIPQMFIRVETIPVTYNGKKSRGVQV